MRFERKFDRIKQKLGGIFEIILLWLFFHRSFFLFGFFPTPFNRPRISILIHPKFVNRTQNEHENVAREKKAECANDWSVNRFLYNHLCWFVSSFHTTWKATIKINYNFIIFVMSIVNHPIICLFLDNSIECIRVLCIVSEWVSVCAREQAFNAFCTSGYLF